MFIQTLHNANLLASPKSRIYWCNKEKNIKQLRACMYVCTPPSQNSAECSLTLLALTHYICEAAEDIAKMCCTHKTYCLLATYLKIFMIASCQAVFNLFMRRLQALGGG